MICLFFNNCVGDHIFIKTLYQVSQSDLFTSLEKTSRKWGFGVLRKAFFTANIPCWLFTDPRDPITLSDDDWGV